MSAGSLNSLFWSVLRSRFLEILRVKKIGSGSFQSEIPNDYMTQQYIFNLRETFQFLLGTLFPTKTAGI